jgi:hypothetical protein
MVDELSIAIRGSRPGVIRPCLLTASIPLCPGATKHASALACSDLANLVEAGGLTDETMIVFHGAVKIRLA